MKNIKAISKKDLIALIIMVAAVVLILVVAVNHVSASTKFPFPIPTPVCGEGLHIGNPHCTPKPTATPTPTLSPSPSPTPQPCADLDLNEAAEFHVLIACTTPTPTPSPTASASATARPTDEPSQGGSLANQLPPACGDIAPPSPQQVTIVGFTKGQMTVHWIPVGGYATANITYQVPNGPSYSALNVANTGVFTIDHLTNDRYYVSVAQVNGCATGPYSAGGLTLDAKAQAVINSLGSK